jgi:hypothetical protein
VTAHPDVCVTTDRRRGLALVRGREAQRAAHAVACWGWPWISPSRRVFVIPLPAADDVSAWCKRYGLLCVVGRRREEAAA